jgi:hypothetical protein
VLLVWLYYSAQIFLFGAEFTKAYANRLGSHIVPKEDAMPASDKARAGQGTPQAAGSNGPASGAQFPAPAPAAGNSPRPKAS